MPHQSEPELRSLDDKPDLGEHRFELASVELDNMIGIGIDERASALHPESVGRGAFKVRHLDIEALHPDGGQELIRFIDMLKDVGEDNHVERAGIDPPSIDTAELNIGMGGLRSLNHRSIIVDADALPGDKRAENRTVIAANVENAIGRTDAAGQERISGTVVKAKMDGVFMCQSGGNPFQVKQEVELAAATDRHEPIELVGNR